MGKKGKGRQCGGYDTKSMRAAFAKEVQEQVQKHRYSSNRRRLDEARTKRYESKERPRLISLKALTTALRERESFEQYEQLERRRRNGFVPQPKRSSCSALKEVDKRRRCAHPGWLLYHDDSGAPKSSSAILENYPHSPSDIFRRDLESEILKSSHIGPSQIQSLQSTCLHILADYLPQYLDGMGVEQLHSTLSLLPAETLSALSILVSSKFQMNNDLAYALGKHAHIRRLSLHVPPRGFDDHCEDEHENEKIGRKTITDVGLRNLWSVTVPLPIYEVGVGSENCDEDDDDDSWSDDRIDDILHFDNIFDSCALTLERLELVHCRAVSADAVIDFLSHVGLGLTHLSLAGSLSSNVGPIVMERLFLEKLCPSLKVLDLSRCAWLTPDVLCSIQNNYRDSREEGKLLVYCKGCGTDTAAVLVIRCCHGNDPVEEGDLRQVGW